MRRRLVLVAAAVAVIWTLAVVLLMWAPVGPTETPPLLPSKPAWTLANGSYAELVGPTAMFARRNNIQPAIETVEQFVRVYVSDSVSDDQGGVWYRLLYRWARTRATFSWAHATPTDQLLRTVEPICPKEPIDLAAIGGTEPPALPQCFGSSDLVLDGVEIRRDGLYGPPVYAGTPAWLASDPVIYLAWRGSGTLGVHIEPGLEAGFVGTVSVTGHFDDRRSEDCVRRPLGPRFSAESVEESIQHCRHHFVITHIEATPSSQGDLAWLKR